MWGFHVCNLRIFSCIKSSLVIQIENLEQKQSRMPNYHIGHSYGGICNIVCQMNINSCTHHSPYPVPAGLLGFGGMDVQSLGIPTVKAYVTVYNSGTGLNVSVRDLEFYSSFVYFRGAAILQGVYKRAVSGNVKCICMQRWWWLKWYMHFISTSLFVTL